MKPIFALVRILGNEMPPRDLSMGRLNTLVQLIREPPLCGVIKFWLINRVWNPELAAAYRELLVKDARLGRVHELPFEPGAYFEADRQGSRQVYCPGINKARNEGLRIAFERYETQFAAAFEGDCGFSREQWEAVSSEIFNDCLNKEAKIAYSVPMIRVTAGMWDAAINDPAMPITGRRDEPQLIISRKAMTNIRYNESPRFAVNADKLELLIRLGHNGETDRWNQLLHEDHCRNIGSCCHINTGSEEVEASSQSLWPIRHEAYARQYADIRRYYQKEPV